MKNDRFHYLVEGACEKKIVEAFKKQQNLIISGKVTEFNVIQETITPMFLRTVAENTTFILVFDTDTDSTDILEQNLRTLAKHKHIKKIWCITQVNNLEDELLRSTDAAEVKNITGSVSNSNFKHDLIVEKRLYEKLMNHHFDLAKFWSTSPTGLFAAYRNQGQMIKK